MQRFVVALALAGIIDAVSYMVVTPSLVFYVLENGGTKEQYGLIMSAFSFASFCTKPFLGWWSDVEGFRVPYISSLTVASIGGALYLGASALPTGNVAVSAILASRLLGGVGAANSALGFAYVARVVPQEEQTSLNSLLSMMRVLGMAAGPGVNMLVAWINVPIVSGWALDPLNSVGLVLIFSNLLAIISIACMLEEPKEKEEAGEYGAHEPKGSEEAGNDGAHDTERGGSKETTKSGSRAVIARAALSMDIFVPILSIFTFNANFQLIETGFAPAANDALGWGPVPTSVALGCVSVVIFFAMFLVIQLSSKFKVSDPMLLSGGLIISTVAYTALYFLWKKGAQAWHFYVPVIAAASSFPFLAAPTRSVFTVAVDSKQALRKYQGSMQAVLSMGASVAGFVTPGLVAAYCLRHPDEVEASSDKRELSAWSLFAPVFSIITLLGVMYTHFLSREKDMEEAFGVSMQDSNELSESDERDLIETSSLLRGPKSQCESGPTRSSVLLDPKVATHRLSACQCMGIPQPSAHGQEQ